MIFRFFNKKAKQVQPPETGKNTASDLLREATALKKGGQIDDAIAALRAAYFQISTTSTDHTIDVFLRLPAYLQVAGRSDEAWQEFNNLLTGGYPNMSVSDWAWYLMESRVHDKMRLFLQRENKAQMAIAHGALSYIAALRAEYERPHSTLSSEYILKSTSTDNIREMLKPLLEKAGILDKLNDAVTTVSAWVSALPETDDRIFVKQLAEVMNT